MISTSQPASARLTSLDALRGFDMIWILGLAQLGGALKQVAGPENWASTQLEHVAWEGFHFEDLIFPLFVFIAGISLTFSLDKTLANGGRGAALRRLLPRVVMLFALGVFLTGGLSNGFEKVRWLGVLQRIALASCGAGLCYIALAPRGPRALWIGLTTALMGCLAGYWALLTFVPVPGFGAGDFAPGHNLTNYFDQQWLAGRKYDGAWDPEGILSTLPAIGTALLGTVAGLWLKVSAAPTRKALGLVIAGLVMLGLGWAWSAQFPVIKKLWTSSFVLVAGGWSALLLGAFYYVIDVRGWKQWATPFVWIGLNPIALYVLENLFPMHRVADRLVGKHTGAWALLPVLIATLLTFLLARFFYRRQMFLRL